MELSYFRGFSVFVSFFTEDFQSIRCATRRKVEEVGVWRFKCKEKLLWKTIVRREGYYHSTLIFACMLKSLNSLLVDHIESNAKNKVHSKSISEEL